MRIENTKVLLIFPGIIGRVPNRNDEYFKTGLLSLYSYLKSKGIGEIRILDMHLETAQGEYIETRSQIEAHQSLVESKLANIDFDIVGISCFVTAQYQGTLLAAECCRKLNPKAKVIVGGWHCLCRPNDFKDSSHIDFVVKGHGERAILDIVRGDVENGGDGPKVIEGKHVVYAEYNDIQINLMDYIRDNLSNINPNQMSSVSLTLSRKCPFSCSFCENRLLKTSKWDPLSVSKSITLIEQCNKHFRQIKEVYFDDALFGLHKTWRNEFFDRLIRRQYPFRFRLMTRIDVIDEEDIRKMNEFNIHLTFGIESLSVDMLQFMNKTKNPERYIKTAVENLLLLNELGISYNFDLILGHPGDSYASQDETYRHLGEILVKGKKIVQLFPYDYRWPAFLDNLDYYFHNFGCLYEGDAEWWKKEIPCYPHNEYTPSSRPNEEFSTALSRYEKFQLFWSRAYRPYIEFTS